MITHNLCVQDHVTNTLCSMEIDVQYFISRLESIDGFGKVGERLAAIVRANEVLPEKDAPEPDATESTTPAEENGTAETAEATEATESTSPT